MRIAEDSLSKGNNLQILSLCDVAVYKKYSGHQSGSNHASGCGRSIEEISATLHVFESGLFSG